MRVGFVSLFPDLLKSAVGHSVLAKAVESGRVCFEFVDPRDFVYDRHRTVDDKPYGGSAGMLVKAEPVIRAVRWLQPESGSAVVFTDPTGRKFDQAAAEELRNRQQLIFVCGRYEGIDERARQIVGTHTFSIGDYVLTGGELPALVMADAVARLIPGVLGSSESLIQDSHTDGLLSAGQFTRPMEVEGLLVPQELTSGDHGAEALWRRKQALRTTRDRRPDLFCRAKLEKQDLNLLS